MLKLKRLPGYAAAVSLLWPRCVMQIQHGDFTEMGHENRFLDPEAV
jgi:hypothetical protein